jgi:hypothetical protein
MSTRDQKNLTGSSDRRKFSSARKKETPKNHRSCRYAKKEGETKKTDGGKLLEFRLRKMPTSDQQLHMKGDQCAAGERSPEGV